MNTNEKENKRSNDFRTLSEVFIRKFHFSIGLLSIAIAITLMLEVFYDWFTLRHFPAFRYDDPVLLISFAWGLVPAAIVSFGKEKSFVQKKNGRSMNFVDVLIQTVLLTLFNMAMIYFGGALASASMPKKEVISVLRLALSVLFTLSVVASFAFAEYVVFRSRGEEGDEYRALTKREIITQLCLYGVNVLTFVACVLSPNS